jgi:hypothetical protein
VIDATGVFGQPNPLGRGGVPATGERALRARIDFGIPDVTGKDRARFEGHRVLVVGGGHSAATTAIELARLSDTPVLWATRTGQPPIPEIPDDPLPAREQLTREANRLALSPPRNFRHASSSVVAGLKPAKNAILVRLISDDVEEEIEVDRIVAQTGFRPDNSIYRELQIHECYASQGPMKLAASLLGADSEDCMAQTGFGPESLANPEPGFFIVGNKSYGRNPNFLLRIGREQIRDVFRLITTDESLDLYAAEKSRV